MSRAAERRRQMGQRVIVKLPKKSDIGDCINWRGTTLLSLIDKAFSPVILQGQQQP